MHQRYNSETRNNSGYYVESWTTWIKEAWKHICKEVLGVFVLRCCVTDTHYSLRERLFSDFGSLALDFVESWARLGRHSVLLDLCNAVFPASALDCKKKASRISQKCGSVASPSLRTSYHCVRNSASKPGWFLTPAWLTVPEGIGVIYTGDISHIHTTISTISKPWLRWAL